MGRTLHDLRREAKDVINHENRRLGIFRSGEVRLVSLKICIRTLGGVFGLDRRELAAGYDGQLTRRTQRSM